MKMWIWARLALCAAPLIAGCSGFWDPPSSGGGGGTTLTSGNFWVLNHTTSASNITGYSIVSGVLTALSSSPYIVTGAGSAMAINTTATAIYVASTNGIYLYAVDSSTGNLTQTSLIFADQVSAGLAVDPSGNWLIDASALGTLNAIPITSGGALDSSRSVQSVNMAADTVSQVAISQNGYILVALGSTGTEVFSFSTSNTTQPIGSTAVKIAPSNTSAGSAVAVAVDPQNRFFFVGETAAFPSSSTNSGGLRAFTYNSGTPQELTGSPYASGGTGPHAITAKSTGDFVYVANWNGTSSGNITGFQVTTANSAYSLKTLTATVATGNEPVGLVEDSKSNFILAINSTGSTPLDAYVFDTTTAGKLNLALTGSTGTGPLAILVP